MTITLTREEAQQVLKALEAEHSAIYGTSQTVKAIELLRARLAQPEPKDDGRCQACEGNHCTAKTGCVALSNPPQNKWEPQIERKYSPDGVLLSEKIKYTPDGEWKDLKQYPVAWWYDMGDVIDLNVSGNGTPLYFVPPQREWQGLTDEEMFDCLIQTDGEAKRLPLGFKWFAEAIEAKLKEKNT
jgi:hypothetical protein